MRTLGLLLCYRVGFQVPLPGMNPEFLQSQGDVGIFGLLNAFSGGAIGKTTIFALGIMPFISASIIFSMLTKVSPTLEAVAKEGAAGQKRINQWTRLAVIPIALIQAIFIYTGVFRPNPTMVDASMADNQVMLALTVITGLMGGALLVMWIGELITEYGVGNGASLIIMAGIISAMPSSIYALSSSPDFWPTLMLMSGIFIVTVYVVVFMHKGARRVPIQYVRLTRGRRVYGGQRHFLPLKVNMAGVMPIIFASAILMFPAQLLRTLGAAMADADNPTNWATHLADVFASRGLVYYLVYGGLILVFSYFWVSIMFKPVQIADDLKKNGGYVPGVRPGDPTARFLDFVMTRLTLAGSIFLTVIAVFPDFIFKTANVSYNVATFFGGTGMLIIVGVILDTMRQIETFLLQRNYDGFLRKGRIRGRSGSTSQGIESLDLKDFEAQWRPLIYISVILFALGLAGFFLKG